MDGSRNGDVHIKGGKPTALHDSGKAAGESGICGLSFAGLSPAIALAIPAGVAICRPDDKFPRAQSKLARRA
jgi:hypothetical protein